MKRQGKLDDNERDFINGLFAMGYDWDRVVYPYDQVSPPLNLTPTSNPNPNLFPTPITRNLRQKEDGRRR